MASKRPHGLDVYTMIIDIVMNLTPLQADNLLSDLMVRYNKKGRVSRYNAEGEEDKEYGQIRLMPFQYRTLRTKYGDTYIKRAFKELTDYINYLKANTENHPDYKSKLRIYTTGTHNKVLKEGGWVYEKCKQYVCASRVQTIKVNPFLIEDFNTAKEYIRNIPQEMRSNAMDVQALLIKFPELIDIPYGNDDNYNEQE